MLSDRSIIAHLKIGTFKIEAAEPFEIEAIQFQPASFEMRLGTRFILRTSRGDSEVLVGIGQPFPIPPGGCLLASTIERLTLPNHMIARVEGKSTWGRKFLQIHSTAGFIDPGFSGEITLEVKNEGHQPIGLRPGDRICQVSFDWLDAPALRPYGHPQLNSHYAGQTGPTLPHEETMQ